MKSILVTGGCGFIGSHFIRFVVQRTSWRVVNVDKMTYAGDLSRLADLTDNRRYRFVRGDIADRDLLEDVFVTEVPSSVVNFAAESHVDRSIIDAAPFLRTNVLGVQSLLESIRRHAVQQFLQVSTDEVYGDLDGEDARSEDSVLRPSNPYAASKAAADLLCLSYARTYGLPVLIVRSSNNYGPAQFPEKLIPLMIRNALAGDNLPVYGTGAQRRDWMHVEDHCDALFRVLDRGAIGAVFNVAADEEHTNLDVVRRICDLVADETHLDREDLRSRIQFVPDRPGHDMRYALRTDRIRRELGWAPRIPFAQGLEQTVSWYVQHRGWLDRLTTSEFPTHDESIHQGSGPPVRR